MELKKYQHVVIRDLRDYLSQLQLHDSLSNSFHSFWESRHFSIGDAGIPQYRNVIDGVPNVCYKIPTGGGKTFLACASLKHIFIALPKTRNRAVVWLVPSDSILSQTLVALKDSSHPYRQRLNFDFCGRVEVYSKEELLGGVNFSPAIVADQLSVMVLSYDSFRSRNKDGRKAYQANGNLSSFANALGEPDQPIKNADETALFQVINQLNPVVVVDESHHTTSELSHEMLKNFNPSFILDLTATPRHESNIISYVDALTLKNENMVKLPVIAYNQSSQVEVITNAIDLRQSLENAANTVMKQCGLYVRPIVLFQAQPKTDENVTSFEKLRDKLVDIGIPRDQIAIKTSSINEIKGVDLLSKDCEIRFIITVNALKEGWDCPFAYVLASLANRTSQVDVEQILGRVLRQPYATRLKNPLLNMSYVLTSSYDFNSTLNNIIAGLNNAGFSKRDIRAANQSSPILLEVPQRGDLTREIIESSYDGRAEEEFLRFEPSDVVDRLNKQNLINDNVRNETVLNSNSMIEKACKLGSEYELEAKQAAGVRGDYVPSDLSKIADKYMMIQDYIEQVSEIRLPQFCIKTPPSALFSTGKDGWDLLNDEALAINFILRDKDAHIDLEIIDEQMYRIDVSEKSDTPRAFRLSASEQKYMREYFSKLSVNEKKRNAADSIYNILKPFNCILDSDLKSYIKRITDNFGPDELLFYQNRPHSVSDVICSKIKRLLDEHKREVFYENIQTGIISLQNLYCFPAFLQLAHPNSLIGGSLYEAEDSMNNYEIEFAGRFSIMSNILWWHRNIERSGFNINGHFNHYPDFIVMTKNGIIVIVEPKGEQLKNDDSRRKVKLGTNWASLAGHNYRYYMVFRDGVKPIEGSINETAFFRILEKL